jgi:hypothetical protein
MFARPAVVVGSVAAVLGAAAVFLSPALAPNRTQAGGMDGWHLPAILAGYYKVNSESDRLDSTHKDWHRQIAASDEVITRLAGGLALLAAVAEIERINADRTPFYYGLLSRYPDTTSHRLRVARWAVDGARRRLRDDPTRLAEASARLDAELRVMLAAE